MRVFVMHMDVLACHGADVLQATLQIAIRGLDLPSRLLDVDSQVVVARRPSPFSPHQERLGVLRIVLDPVREQDAQLGQYVALGF
jgi:hypothetical protein